MFVLVTHAGGTPSYVRDAPPARGLEYTSSLGDAVRFPTGAAAPVAAVLRQLIGELQALDGAPASPTLSRRPEGVGEPDRLLTAPEVAARLQVSVKLVYRTAARWPFTRRLSPGVLRFSERG